VVVEGPVRHLCSHRNGDLVGGAEVDAGEDARVDRVVLDVGGNVVVLRDSRRVPAGQPASDFSRDVASQREDEAHGLVPDIGGGIDMHGQPPSITATPFVRPYSAAALETLPAPGPRCIHTCLTPSSAHSPSQ
jgi:hypothetical protein